MKSATPTLKEHKIGFHIVWALLAAGVYAAVDKLHHGDTFLAVTDDATRSALYISVAATSGALLGFAITGITILLTLGGGRRIDWLYKDERFAYARTIFLGAIHALALSTVYFSAMIVVDTKTDARPVLEYIGTFFAVLVLLRVHVIVKLLGDLLDIAIADRRDEGKAHPNPPFRQPV